MKKTLLLLITIAIVSPSLAQTHTKPAFLGVNFFLNDFATPKSINSNGLPYVVRNKQLFKPSTMTPGMAISYVDGLSDHVDLDLSLGGSFIDYPLRYINSPGNAHLLLEAVGAINVKLLSDRYFFTPYLQVGVGASKYQDLYAAFMPIGTGMQFNFSNEAFLFVNTQYRVPVSENSTGHFYYSFGLAGQIGKKKIEAPKVVEIPVVVQEVPKDRDGDGVLDNVDACPDVAGPASLSGCPDRDGDGIADNSDNCPDLSGLARYQGCPVPDTDKDGINDEEDKCPNAAGVARYQGCPVPDTDRDGVNDEDDKCPNEAGPASNFGCPVIEQAVIEKVNLAAKNIFFATGSSKLLPKSYASLNNVVKILNDNPSYRVDVSGHTDNVGTSEKNHVLSHDRANSVRAYIVSKGIDESRITSEGYGFDQPIADNKTAAGRAQNRRVGMKLRNY